jgi:pyrimidine-nucleoside phosphorylase
MDSEEKALQLARALVAIGARYGKRTVAFLTSMDQPLGFAIGNWLEVVEAVECLRGKNVPDLMEVTTVLAGAMVWLGEKADTIEEGMKSVRSAIWSGNAYEKFLELVAGQGGDVRPLREPGLNPPSSVQLEVLSDDDGFVSAFQTRMIGMLAIELGAGRKTIEDRVDPTAGVVLQKKLGDHVHRGDILARVFTGNRSAGEHVARALRDCIQIHPASRPVPSRIRNMVDDTGIHPWKTPVVH